MLQLTTLLSSSSCDRPCSLAPSIVPSYGRAIKSQSQKAFSSENWPTNVASKRNISSHHAPTMLLTSSGGFVIDCKAREANNYQRYGSFSAGKWRTSVADAKPARKQKSFRFECSAVSKFRVSLSYACCRLLSKISVSGSQRTKNLNGVKKDTRRVSAAADHGSTALPAGDAVVARDDLLGLISGEDRGLKTQKDAQKRASIIRVIDALTKLGANSTTTDSSLSATWRMLWTTEKEQLFIIEKAPLFGTQAGDNLQVIDIARGTLNNIITFPPSGAFVVGSTIEVVSKHRVKFRFQSAVLCTAKWKLPLPPFGQGWFESVYLDDKIRVAKDIRGDYLVVDRAPHAFEGLEDI